MTATPPDAAPAAPTQPHAQQDSAPASAAQDPAAAPNKWQSLLDDMRPVLNVLKWLEAHPWIVASYFATVIAIKVMSVAKGDMATAGVILGSGGFLGLASVIILAILPGAVASVFLITGVLVGATAGANIKKSQQASGNTAKLQLKAVSTPLVATVFFGVIAAILVPWVVIPVVIVLMIWMGATLYSSNKKDLANNPTATPSIGGGGRSTSLLLILFAVAVAVVAAALNSSTWFPVERITVGGKPYVGYVISNDGSYATILIEDGRKTITAPSESVTSRERCDLSDPFSVALPLLGNTPSYGPCETAK